MAITLAGITEQSRRHRLGLLVTGGVAEVALKPCLSIEPHAQDFGTIPPGATVIREIVLRNRNLWTPFHIVEAKTTCQCTVASLSNETIPPRGTVILSVQLIAGSAPGRTTQQVLIRGTGRREEIQVITVEAMIDPVLELIPSLLDFGFVREEDLPVEKSVRVRPALGRKMDFSINPTTDDLHVRVTIQPATESESLVLSVNLMPGAPCGYVEGSIFLESSKWQSRIRLPLGGKLLGKVHSDPEAIFFGRLKRGSAVGRVIQINGIDAQPAALRARVYPDSLTSVFESKLDGATRCTLRFNGKGDTGIVNGKLIISEEGGREFISVPVTGNIE